MPKAIAEMVIESAVMELPDTKTIRLEWPQGYDVDFKTGQFITLYWPDTPNYKRAYSLSSCALDRGFFEVTVKRDGKMGTRIVDCAKAGDRMGVVPPTGKGLPVYQPNKHLLCIAGGSGVTPFLAFVREATGRQLETRLTILYFYLPSTRLNRHDAWTGRRGRTAAAWVKHHIHALPNPTFYACGPNEL